MKILLSLLLALAPTFAWANDFYTHGSFPATGSAATSAGMRAELDLITAGFDKMPSLTGNASRAVIVNGSGTALSLTTGTLTLPGNFALSGANNVTLTTSGATNVTLPTTGTLATLAGSETFTTKSVDLANNTLTGTLAQFNTACSNCDFLSVAGTESPTGKTIDLASNTLTGTLAQFNTACSNCDFASLAGAETLSGPKTLASPILSGTPVFPDNVFTIGGSADATKKIAIEVDGLTTGTTRTITAPNQDLALANVWVGQNDFRLSLTTGVPVTTSDVTSAGTLYAVPYTGNRIALYNGTNWVLRNSAQFSLALTLTSGKPYDVFCYDNAGTATLEVLVWTNDTTRATALTRQDGVLVKNGDATRRYLGSLYASGANVTEDSLANRYLWNYYHRVPRALRHTAEGTNTWTYTTNTFRQANANTANQVNFVVGVAEDAVHGVVRGISYNSSANINRAVGIGLDSTSVDSSRIRIATGSQSAINVQTHDTAEYRDVVAEGKHSLVWLEISQAAGGTTWLGDDGGVYVQTGLTAQMVN